MVAIGGGQGRGRRRRLRLALATAAATAATAAFAPPAQAHYLVPSGGKYVDCNRQNGVYCTGDLVAKWATTRSHMHTIPDGINYICAGAYNSDGSGWKNASGCFRWSQTHRADVVYQTPTWSRIVGWWQGWGAANWIRVEAELT
jgi:hypothetical protein